MAVQIIDVATSTIQRPADRTCGKCRECCIHVGVEALGKEPGVPCLHILDNNPCGSCGIYETRPSECAAYHCSWRDGLGGLDFRPDQSGIFLETSEIFDPEHLKMALGWETRPNAIADNFQRLCDAAGDEWAVIVIPHAGGQPLIIGNPRNARLAVQFIEKINRDGSVLHQMNDGLFLQDIHTGEMTRVEP